MTYTITPGQKTDKTRKLGGAGDMQEGMKCCFMAVDCSGILFLCGGWWWYVSILVVYPVNTVHRSIHPPHLCIDEIPQLCNLPASKKTSLAHPHIHIHI